MTTIHTKPLTAEEFYEFCDRPENRDRFFELERGEIVEVNRPGERRGVVWVVDPATCTVTVYRTGRNSAFLQQRDELTGQDQLFDLRLRVSDLFALLGETTS